MESDEAKRQLLEELQSQFQVYHAPGHTSSDVGVAVGQHRRYHGPRYHGPRYHGPRYLPVHLKVSAGEWLLAARAG